ncbi:hypothetical protein [Saccharococcus caldoxylosilyticus]|uniref:hypothetical protein n=1 Tax=Saccharococcus caldoxylosilyticus TaxID=81408 RepID=UPI00117ADFBF|nr:hypothetical protein [Parageobacillus caldoxylosilyticus]
MELAVTKKYAPKLHKPAIIHMAKNFFMATVPSLFLLFIRRHTKINVTMVNPSLPTNLYLIHRRLPSSHYFGLPVTNTLEISGKTKKDHRMWICDDLF